MWTGDHWGIYAHDRIFLLIRVEKGGGVNTYIILESLTQLNFKVTVSDY